MNKKANMDNKKVIDIIESAVNSLMDLFNIPVDYQINAAECCFGKDATLVIENILFNVDVRVSIKQSHLNQIIDSCHKTSVISNRPLIIVVGDITENLMNKLFAEGINVMDAAGNCRVRHEQLMLLSRGLKSKAAKEKDVLSFRGQGFKILQLLLSDIENVNLTFREIQDITGVSLSTINKIFHVLQSTGYVYVSGNKRFMKNTKQLLNVFVDSYTRILKPKSMVTTMKFVDNWREKWTDVVLPEGMVWGGEPGAYIKDRYLFPEVFDIYSSTAYTQLIAEKIAIPAKNGEIRIYKKTWSDSDDRTAPSLIIYADLMGSGDSRCIEAANRIYEKELYYLG